MTEETVERLRYFFSLYPILRPEGVPEQGEIDAAERELDVHFCDDYRWFLATFGGGIVGSFQLFGLRRAPPMDVAIWSVVASTKRFRADGWGLPRTAYVVSEDHSGNPIYIDESDEVLLLDHDIGTKSVVANSFEAFLRKCLRANES